MAPEGGLTAAWRVARGRKRPPGGAAGHMEGIESHVERPADSRCRPCGADRHRMTAAQGAVGVAAEPPTGVETVHVGLSRAARTP